MSTTNENILKSLTVLEQNLKDINSAKEQVNNVVETSGKLAKAIESYQTSFESLSINVKAVLEDSRKFNLDSSSKLAEQLNKLSTEVLRLETVDFEHHFNEILTTLTNHTDKQQVELSKKYEEVKIQGDNIILDIIKQNKETKTLKTLLFLTIGIVIIGIIINLTI